MRFVVIYLSVLVLASFVPLSEANAKTKCNVNKITSSAYYKCKAKQVGGWFKKKAKSGGKKAKKVLKDNPVSDTIKKGHKKLSETGVKKTE